MSKKKFKNIVTIISVSIIVFSVLFFAKLSNRIVKNRDGAVGNTACNLYNGGLFCEDDERIYFSNLNDSGSLYSMSKQIDDFKYIYEDTVGYLNNTTEYIVYSRMNYTRRDGVKRVLQFSQSGLYRLAKSGRHSIGGIYSFNIGRVGVVGNDIYYQRLEKDGNMQLYRADLSGKNEEIILDEDIVLGTLTKNRIYYSGGEETHYIHYYDVDSKKNVIVYKGNCLNPAKVGEHIYFLSLSNNYNLSRIDEMGKNPTILVEDRCSFYNITEDEQYAVYQVDDQKNSRLEIINLSSLEKKTIREGDYNSINIIGNKVFFREFNTDEIYYFDIESPDNVMSFDPPDLSE